MEAAVSKFNEAVRKRPGMYIGTTSIDGVYNLLQEILDNSVDEFMSGYGGQIELKINENGQISVRDYGRGIPFDKMFDAASNGDYKTKTNTKSFKKSISSTFPRGGLVIVNALSSFFSAQSFCSKKTKKITFSKGVIKQEYAEEDTGQSDGAQITFIPDETIFTDYQIDPEDIKEIVKRYVFLNKGLIIIYNGCKYISENGLIEFFHDKIKPPLLYSPVHLTGEDIEIVFCHNKSKKVYDLYNVNLYPGEKYYRGEEYHGFINGLYTMRKGTHISAFRTAYTQTIREFFGKKFDDAKLLTSLFAVISIKVLEPVFEGSTGQFVADGHDEGYAIVTSFIADFVRKELKNYLQKHSKKESYVAHFPPFLL
jgi:topoisomerase-4 subunit B